jgi:hypothetical protein
LHWCPDNLGFAALKLLNTCLLDRPGSDQCFAESHRAAHRGLSAQGRSQPQIDGGIGLSFEVMNTPVDLDGLRSMSFSAKL